MFWLIAFAAGLARGYSGFGFAMLLVLGLMTRLPPGEAVPVALLLDLLGSVGLWRQAWRSAHRPVLARLLAGTLLAVPLGAWLLVWLPAGLMVVLVALCCLAGGLLVLCLRPAAGPVRPLLAWPAGLVAGLATSMASSGGPPLMLYLLCSGLAADRLRGTAVAFFALCSALSLLGLLLAGVLTAAHGTLALELLLPALLGTALGQWLHARWQPLPMHLVMGGLLVALSLASLLLAGR